MLVNANKNGGRERRRVNTDLVTKLISCNRNGGKLVKIDHEKNVGKMLAVRACNSKKPISVLNITTSEACRNTSLSQSKSNLFQRCSVKSTHYRYDKKISKDLCIHLML